MNRVVLIKYGELTTKKGNRKFFINTLYNNIKKKMTNLDVSISKDISRMYIEFNDKDLDKVLERLNLVFGIHTYQVAYKVDSDIETIKEVARDIMKDKTGTFKVETKRSDKNFPIESIDFSRTIGGVVLKSNSNLSVDVHNPDTKLDIEILPRYTYLYTDKYYGLGGYPVGVQSKGMLMLSGGIDSPVAGFLALKRGVKLEAVYFEAIPHTSLEARNKVIDLSKKLCKYCDTLKLHIVPFTSIQEAIYKECNPDYTITIMRRMMYRIMERLAKRNKGLIIINGESIGQVASQTLTSMSAIGRVVNIPVIRPVACLDKLDIIDIAKDIDTYDISIEPYEDCCTIFVPDHPVINPEYELCEEYENNFNWQDMIKKCIEEETVIKIENKISEEHSSIL